MDQLGKNFILSQLHCKHWLLIKREDSPYPYPNDCHKNFLKTWKTLDNTSLIFAKCLCLIRFSCFPSTFATCQRERTISKVIFHLLANCCLSYCLYLINIYKYTLELSSKIIWRTCVFFIPKPKHITYHIYLFAKAARRLRDKYND